jgi:TetR/AcrR family transcriptional regulator, mexJK operon transcriptional repressor
MILTSIATPPAAAPTAVMPDPRRMAFVAAAQAAFFENGYGGTTMSSIVAAVGGSKTTLWNHFPSKHALFAAVVDDIVGRYGTALAIDLPPAAPVAETLARFASAMLATILSSPIIDLHRMVTGEAGRFPELAAMFWERGPARGKARLAAYLAAAMADGRLRHGDPMLAARQFAALCQSGGFQQVVLGLGQTPNATAIARDVTDAVDSFMRAWGRAEPTAQ